MRRPRRRLRLGLVPAARRHRARRLRRRHHALGGAGRLRPRADRGAGLADRVEIRVQDWRDVDRRPVRRDPSIGMAEQSGARGYAEYAAALHDLLRPGGRLLNHQISRRPGPSTGRHLVHRPPTCSPTASCCPLATTVGALEEVGLRGPRRRGAAGALRPDAAVLGRQPGGRLGPGGRADVQGRARVWRLYMAGVGALLRAPTGSGSTRCWRCGRVPAARAASPRTRDPDCSRDLT